MTLRDDDSLMLAYVYGELTDEDARAFEQRLDGDAGLRAEVEGLLATREMLGEDARYGSETGLDLPPPQLTDAILRAEALARPAEIRQAAIRHGQGASGSGGFLARIQLWLVGGGLAVTATAALFLVAKDGSSPDAVMMPEASPAAVMAEEAAAADQKANQKMAREPLAEAEPAQREQPARTFGRPAPAAPLAAQPAQDALQEQAPAPDPASGAVSGERQAAAKDAEEGEAEASKAEASKDDAASGGLLQPPAERIGAGDGEGFALDHDGVDDSPASESRMASDSLEQRSARGAEKEKKAETSSLSFADDERDAYAAPAGKSSAAPADGPAQAKAKGDSLGGAALGTGARGDAKPTAGMGSSSSRSQVRAGAPPPARAAPPALPEVARRELAKKRAARSRAPSSDKSADVSASKALENNRFDELQLSLVTAERELSEGRALDALDMFTSVAEQDPRGALVGVVPYVGQMRALSALGRHREVLAILPTVKRPGIKAAGVAEGIFVAARSAEALAQTALARQLYRELLVVKERRKDAEAGLARLDAQARVRSKKASAPAEASSADEPAAASEPRGKN